MVKNKSQQPKIDMPLKEDLDNILLRPYSDEELQLTPELEEKIKKLIEYFDSSGIDYGKVYDKFLPKNAYPNNESYFHIPGQRDTKKWLEAVRTIFSREKNGESRPNAIRATTSGWNVLETYDFLNWLKFYEEGAHLKYKFAQLWYENGAPGYFLHVKKDPEPTPEPEVNGKDIDFAREEAADSLSSSEKRRIIEKQRNKLVGRLDSAEKLLRTTDGQLFAGKEYETLIESIYQLKKKIHMVNKVSTSTRIYEDMIVREGNVLARQGFKKAANLLYSLADDPNAIPEAAPPAPPAESSGAPGGLPSMGPGAPQTPIDNTPKDEEATAPPGIAKFLDNLETGKVTKKDEHGAEDELEVFDSLDVEDSEEDLVVEAQAAPPAEAPEPLTPPALEPDAAKPAKPVPAKTPSDKAVDLEVTEDDLKPKPSAETPAASDFDSKVNTLLAGLSVNDVISKLEELSKIFKTREIPRQLSIVDMMLDSMGLASYFPGLSEAQNKALESNNYISTRVEDILSKLRGSVATKDIDLKGAGTPDNPEVAGIKGKLQQDEDKEKARKQMRKEQENLDMENNTKETPEVEIEEDLAPKAPPAPPAPKAAPLA